MTFCGTILTIQKPFRGRPNWRITTPFVVRRHGAIKRSRPLDDPGAIILLRRKPPTERVVSHFPNGRWPILEAVSKPGKIEGTCGRI
jgi:hypothetical protein